MKRDRKVYTYRSLKSCLKTFAWLVFGPIFIIIWLDSIYHPTSHRLSLLEPEWMKWIFVVMFACMVIGEFVAALQIIFERVILEGSRLTYYNWFGWKRISVDMDDIKEIDLVRGPQWDVFTPQGRFSFDTHLRQHQELLEVLSAAGTVINPFRARL